MTSLVTEEHEEDPEEEEEEEEDDAAAPPAEPAAGVPSQPVLRIPAVNSLDSLYGLREIGREALCWQLSSAKPGNGVEQIRDQSTDTYWQSDGMSQPHWIQVHFARRVAISHVCLYLDYNLDESYTPKHLSIQVGMTTHDLAPAIYPVNTLVEFHEPVGWCTTAFRAEPGQCRVVGDGAQQTMRIEVGRMKTGCAGGGHRRQPVVPAEGERLLDIRSRRKFDIQIFRGVLAPSF